MYSRDEIKALTDKVLNMAKADAVEVSFDGGERSATRWANSSITVNLVQYDQQLTLTVRHGQKAGSAFDARVRRRVAEGDGRRSQRGGAEGARQPQPHAAGERAAGLRPGRRRGASHGGLRPGRARGVGQAVGRHLREERRARVRLHPKAYQTTCLANSEGLFAYYQYAETGFVLTCRMANGSGRDGPASPARSSLSQVEVAQLTEVAANKAVKSQKPRAIEPGRYTTILEPRPAARFLSTMMGAFNAGRPGGGFGGGWRRRVQLRRHRRPFVSADGTPKTGQKLFSDSFTLKSDVGNPILRQTPIMNDGTARQADHLDRKGRAEERVLRRGQRAATESRAVARHAEHEPVARRVEPDARGHDQVDAPRTARDLLLVYPPVDTLTLLQTGMTRDGLFLIQNGEIAGPVQNFRWNMSPLVGFANISAIGTPVPIHTGEAYDGPGTALVPPVRMKTST
jgi:predicted Zn-dependent protease